MDVLNDMIWIVALSISNQVDIRVFKHEVDAYLFANFYNTSTNIHATILHLPIIDKVDIDELMNKLPKNKEN